MDVNAWRASAAPKRLQLGYDSACNASLGGCDRIYAPMYAAAGTRLGPYEILDHLGTGGMGEVYARDTRLNRLVAICSGPMRFLKADSRLEPTRDVCHLESVARH